MSEFSVNKYMVKANMVILGHLFLVGDLIYIQSYDSKAGRPQQVFTEKKELIGAISSRSYWDINKDLEEMK